MANHISHAALPYCVKNARYTIPLAYLDADGDPTDPTTPDTEISKDAGAFADCAEEASTITGSNGSAYITLTGAETDCSLAILAAKVASGPKATLVHIKPRVLAVLFSGTATAGAAGSITLATDIPAIADLLIGCIVKTTGGTGGGGTGGANNQARVITDFSTGRVATVSPNWETAPDNTTTYEVLLTEQSLMRFADLKAILGTIVSTPATAGILDVNLINWRNTQPANLQTTFVQVAVKGMDANVITSATLDSTCTTELQSGLATQSSVDAIAAYVDTEVAAIKAKTDNLPADTNAVLNTIKGDVLIDTTIATLAGQNDFTLTAGSADDNAYFGHDVIIHDAVTAEQKAVMFGSTYTGSTKRLTTVDVTRPFTIAVGDRVVIKVSTAQRPTVHGRTLDVSSGGNAGIDWGNVVNPSTAVDLTATKINDVTKLGTPAGASVSADIAAVKADTAAISGYVDTEVASILAAVDTEVAAIKAKTDNLPANPASQTKLDTIYDQMTEDDGGVRRFTANALEQAPGGAGATPQLLVDTTVASLTSQTVFRLTAGPTIDDALNNQTIVLYDVSGANNPSVRKILDYTGATKEVTVDAAPGFTMVAGDSAKVFVTAAGATAPTEAQVADKVLDEWSKMKMVSDRSDGTLTCYKTDGSTVRGKRQRTSISADQVGMLPI